MIAAWVSGKRGNSGPISAFAGGSNGQKIGVEDYVDSAGGIRACLSKGVVRRLSYGAGG
jgi:hypothetical protein